MRDFPLTALAAGVTVLIVTGAISSEILIKGLFIFAIFFAIKWVLESIFGVYD